MTDATTPRPHPASPAAPARRSLLIEDARTKRRNAAERRFRAYGVVAIGLAMAALVFLLFTIFRDGSSAFFQTYARIPVAIEAQVVDPAGNRDPAEMQKVLTMGYGKLLDNALAAYVEENGIQIEGLSERDLSTFFSAQGRADLRNAVLADPALVGTVIEAPVSATRSWPGSPMPWACRWLATWYVIRSTCSPGKTVSSRLSAPSRRRTRYSAASNVCSATSSASGPPAKST